MYRFLADYTTANLVQMNCTMHAEPVEDTSRRLVLRVDQICVLAESRDTALFAWQQHRAMAPNSADDAV